MAQQIDFGEQLTSSKVLVPQLDALYAKFGSISLGDEGNCSHTDGMTEEEKRTKAWIGDAVLALFAREWILKQKDISPEERAEVFVRMTSNKFLAALGEPTAMEAEIGTVYENQGIGPAFAHIEAKFLPVFKKQWKKSKLPGSYRKKKGQ